MKKKYNWLLTYCKTVKLLFKISPPYLFFTVVLSLIVGISTPITIYIWKDVINSIESILKVELDNYLGYHPYIKNKKLK